MQARPTTTNQIDALSGFTQAVHEQRWQKTSLNDSKGSSRVSHVMSPMSPPNLTREMSERVSLKRESSAKEIKKALSKISLESKFKLNIMASHQQLDFY